MRLTKKAFTLTELLVVVTMIAALAALAFPVVSGVMKAKSATVCLANIRQIGQTFSAYIADTNGPITHWYYGAQAEGVSVHWQHPLILGKYLTANDLKKIRCPSIPPEVAYNDDHYAFNLGDPYGKAEKVPPEQVNGNTSSMRYVLYARVHPEPAKSILFADAYSPAGAKLRFFKTGAASDGRIQLRHQNKASLYFLDGHAELANRGRLYDLGIREVFSEDFRRETLQPSR